MKARKALTLLEVVVAMAIMGLIIFTGWSVLTNVVGQSAKSVGNVATQTEAKHVVESMVTIVRDASELEILDGKPDTFDGESKYLYTENGVVHYFDGIEDIVINVSNNDNNELIFSGDTGKNILNYEIKSIRGKEEYSSNSSVILNNLEKGIVNSTTSGSGHCIRFKAEDNVALIVEFNLLKAENPANGFEDDAIGYIADGYIELWVPKEVRVEQLNPSVKFFGDKVVVSYGQLADHAAAINMPGVATRNKYELEIPSGGIDFSGDSGDVYYYVVTNDVVKEYKVVVKQDTEEMKVQIRQGIPVAWEDSTEAKTSAKTIVFDEDFIAYVPNSSNAGTYTWYVQGVSKPIKSGPSNTLTVQELADHNNKTSTKIEGGIDDTKYDKDNPNDNEDAMLYLIVKFTPERSTTTYNSEPVIVYPVTRNDLYKEFSDFYFKIATDVWVKSRMLEEVVDLNTGKTGKDMALEFMEWYKVNTGKVYDPESVKLNTKKATDVNKVYPDTLGKNLNYGYDKAPEIVRTMYKMSPTGSGGKYEIKPTIFICGDNTTSTAPMGSYKNVDSPYARTAFSIDVDYFNTKVNKLGDGSSKITNLVVDANGEINTYQFEVTVEPGKLDYVKTNNKEFYLDVAEKMDIQKLAVGVFNDQYGNGFRYMTGGNAEPQISSKSYLKVLNYTDIYTSTHMDVGDGLAPYESGNIFGANLMQEYVLDNTLKNKPAEKLDSITLKVNTVRQPDTSKSKNSAGAYETQGKSLNTYVEILKNGNVIKGQLPTPSNTGKANISLVTTDLFSSVQSASLMIGNTSIYARNQYGRKTLRSQAFNPQYTTYGYGAPGYIGVAYNTWYDKMLIGDNLYSANTDGRYSGNLIRTNTTKVQNQRTYGSTTMGNFITVGSANDSHENNNTRLTSGTNANRSLKNDQYVHYITNMDLTAGYESEPIKVVEAKIISNLTIASVPVTAVEMTFNKPIRSGYGPELYKIDGITPVNIDSAITSHLTSNNGKNVLMNTVDDTNKLPVMEPDYNNAWTTEYGQSYVSNLNARGITIKEPSSNTKYGIHRNNDFVASYAPDKIGDQHFVYKTGENTLVAIFKGTLDKTKTYDIEFERGSVQAMIGGAVPIENGKTTPVVVDKVAWSIIPDGLQLDENGGVIFSVDLSNADGHATANVSEDGESVYLKSAVQYYRDTGYIKDKLRQNVNLKDGFVVTVKSMKEKPYDQWNNNAFSAITVYNNQNDIGYALVMTDYTFGWGGDFDTINKPNFGIHAIKNHLPMNASGNVISSNDNSNYEMIGLRNGKLYYDRKAGKYYTYKATFKTNTIKLEVFDENDVLLDTRNVTIPAAQYNQQKDLEFNTIDMQSGRNNTYFKQISVDFLP